MPEVMSLHNDIRRAHKLLRCYHSSMYLSPYEELLYGDLLLDLVLAVGSGLFAKTM